MLRSWVMKVTQPMENSADGVKERIDTRSKTGVFASPYRVGNIGMGIMGRFRLVLDYAYERMAFARE